MEEKNGGFTFLPFLVGVTKRSYGADGLRLGHVLEARGENFLWIVAERAKRFAVEFLAAGGVLIVDDQSATAILVLTCKVVYFALKVTKFGIEIDIEYLRTSADVNQCSKQKECLQNCPLTWACFQYLTISLGAVKASKTSNSKEENVCASLEWLTIVLKLGFE